jgi:hypothetical protein
MPSAFLPIDWGKPLPGKPWATAKLVRVASRMKESPRLSGFAFLPEEGWWSDGKLALRVEGKEREKLCATAATLERDEKTGSRVAYLSNQLNEWAAHGYHGRSVRPTPCVVTGCRCATPEGVAQFFVWDGERSCLLNCDYVATVRKRHPGAFIHLDAESSAQSPAQFVEGGRTVALLMPLS